MKLTYNINSMPIIPNHILESLLRNLRIINWNLYVQIKLKIHYLEYEKNNNELFSVLSLSNIFCKFWLCRWSKIRLMIYFRISFKRVQFIVFSGQDVVTFHRFMFMYMLVIKIQGKTIFVHCFFLLMREVSHISF